MSDSELSDAPVIPSDTELEKSLRGAVIKAQKAREEVTVNDIRKRSARALGLDEAFFSSDADWKGKSKEIIKSQFDRGGNDDEKTHEVAPVSKPTKKRASPATSAQPRKKAKSAKSAHPEVSATTKGSKVARSRDEPPPALEPTSASKDDDSSSDLSSLVDGDPAPKKSRAKSDTTSKTAKANSSKSKDKPSTDGDPEAEEIKRLQSWLSKCGIRKVWGAYLKPYPSSKDKIKHLKQMLADAGMTGRYSNEKASQIKEARELAADIEAVQEGNERWGKDGEEDGEDGQDPDQADRSKAGRKLIRGSKHFDFLSSDGEETD